MENKMNEVAKLLGVELEEEFKIGKNGLIYEEFKFTVNGLMFWSDNHQDWFYSPKLEQLLIGYYEIIKIPKPILDDVEKEYLSAVTKPFRDSVVAIIKCKYDDYYEFIQIEVNQERYEYVNLPNFKKDIMYKGMEIDKGYTLEELGI